MDINQEFTSSADNKDENNQLLHVDNESAVHDNNQYVSQSEQESAGAEVDSIQISEEEKDQNANGQTPITDTKPVKAGGGWRKKLHKPLARTVALCLVCSVLGGLLAVGVERLTLNSSSSGSGTTKVVLGAQQDKQTSVITNVSSSNSSELTPNEIYNKLCPSIVGITSKITSTNVFGQSANETVSGTGFIISADGYIATNYHVVETAQESGQDIQVVLNNGSTYKAELKGYYAANDIAVLKIDATGLTAVTFGDSGSLQVGDKAYAIGNPLGELTYTLTSGLVSALDREITFDANTTINMFQFDAAVNAGNSGGPVLNAKGEVIGIVTAKASETGTEGLGFAIPVNDALTIIQDLIEKGYVSGRPYFGITVISASDMSAQNNSNSNVNGAYVYTVDQNSCAAKAGLKVGDIITKLGDTDIASSSDLIAAKKKYAAGNTVKITVYRDNGYVELSITFDEETPSVTSSNQNSAQDNQGNTQQRGNGNFWDGNGSDQGGIINPFGNGKQY